MSGTYKNKPTHKGYNTAVKFNCDYCAAECYESRNSYKRTKRHFCSRKCYSLFRAEKLPVEEQPSYGSDLTPEDVAIRKKARATLNHYLRDKKMQRPPCEICNDPKSEAHHDDYSKPLDVKWLCFKHHRMYHKIGSKLYDNPELIIQ